MFISLYVVCISNALLRIGDKSTLFTSITMKFFSLFPFVSPKASLFVITFILFLIALAFIIMLYSKIVNDPFYELLGLTLCFCYSLERFIINAFFINNLSLLTVVVIAIFSFITFTVIYKSNRRPNRKSLLDTVAGFYFYVVHTPFIHHFFTMIALIIVRIVKYYIMEALGFGDLDFLSHCFVILSLIIPTIFCIRIIINIVYIKYVDPTAYIPIIFIYLAFDFNNYNISNINLSKFIILAFIACPSVAIVLDTSSFMYDILSNIYVGFIRQGIFTPMSGSYYPVYGFAFSLEEDHNSDAESERSHSDYESDSENPFKFDGSSYPRNKFEDRMAELYNNDLSKSLGEIKLDPYKVSVSKNDAELGDKVIRNGKLIQKSFL